LYLCVLGLWRLICTLSNCSLNNLVFLCSLIIKNTIPAIAATPSMTIIAALALLPVLKPLFLFVFNAAVEVDEVDGVVADAFAVEELEEVEVEERS